MTLNPITIKPRTTRTKSLVLKGAKGKHARNDGRNKRLDRACIGCSDCFPRTIASTQRAIREQLNQDDFDMDVIYAKDQVGDTPSLYTSETPPVQKPMLPELKPVAKYDEYGRRIVVVNTEDAWSLVGRNRY